ncbi:MAG: energy transducer TonB [Cyclobacteriaceae bacterium]
MEPKKKPEADLGRKTGLFFAVGLCISLSLTILAFEWKNYDRGAMKNLGEVEDNFEDIMEVPPTEQPPPPPPKIQQPQIQEVPDEEEIEEDIELDLDVEITEETVIEDIVIEEAPEEEVADEIFTIVEDKPTPPGGMAGWGKYLQKNLKYPTQAKRMGTEGRVYVQFVVGKDGSISEVKAIKGIGSGCDEEAERVIRNAPKWNPGKQRGRPVKVRMVVPIVFKLSR